MQKKDEKDRLSYDIEALIEKTCINRSAVYKAIASGELRSFKVGRSRLFSDAAVREYIVRLEEKSRVAA